MSGIFRGAGTGGGGSGDVVGPASSTDDHFVLFDGTTGKLLKDSGYATVPETSGGTGQSAYTQGDLLYSSAANTLSKLALPRAGAQLMSDGTDVYWASPSNTLYIYEDFYNELNNGTIGFRTRSNGAGSGVNNFIIAPAGHPGIVTFTTGTTTTGRANIQCNEKTITIGGGIIACEWCISIPTLSDGVDNYIIRAGLGNVESYSSTRPNNCIYFEYAYDGTAPYDNWRIVASAAGVSTDNDSNVAVTTDFVRLRFEINAAASSVEYFINGTSVGTITTNIPTTFMGLNTGIVKTLGTNNREMRADYVMLYQKFTTIR